MSTTTTWPTQITLPGQAAAPEGPLDMWMMYVAHRAYRRDLDLFCSAVEHTPVEQRRVWAALAARWSIFGLALHHHHHAEDVALWPLLESRTDAAGRRLLAEMEAEHAEIDPVLTAITDGLSAMTGQGDADTRAALQVRMVAGRERLCHHLGHEETQAIALMQQVMTQPEWLTMQADHFKPRREEITLLAVRNMMGWTTDGLPTAIRDRVLADAPGGRLIWRLTVPGYLRRERFAFRYATV